MCPPVTGLEIRVKLDVGTLLTLQCTVSGGGTGQQHAAPLAILGPWYAEQNTVTEREQAAVLTRSVQHV